MTEALTNVLKHADATGRRVADVCRWPPPLRVSDDGRGFNPDIASQNGLVGLRDRIRALGGTVTIVSRPGRNPHVGVAARGSAMKVVIAEDHYLVREGHAACSSRVGKWWWRRPSKVPRRC